MLTFRQVSVSSSATSARRPSSWGMRAGAAARSPLTGKRRETVNSEPFPGSLSTEMPPSIMSIRFFVIAMPRPVP